MKRIRNIAIIPLRGGSKSIPKKNIRNIAGKPLCAWNITAAVESKVFDKILVSTDSTEITEVVDSLGLGVTILKRPEELATDTASTESVMLHCARSFDFDIMTLIQVTTPFARPKHFREASQMFERDTLDSLLSGVRQKHFFWNTDGTPLNYTPSNRPRRQDFPGVFRENGCFYMTKCEILLNEKCRIGGKTGIYEMPDYSAIDIDEEDDWNIAENRIERYILPQADKLCNIRLFITDVDGVLTDGGMYYSENGDEMKRFNTRDGKGIELIRKAGIKTSFITSETTELVRRRAKKLKIDYLYQGRSYKGKLETIKEICCKEGISLEQVAYIGDDVNCLEALHGVGFPACPADAQDEVKKTPGILKLSRNGGCGVVREFIDLILNSGARDENPND